MDILTIDEYQSLTTKPKLIRGHYFSFYEETIMEDDDTIGWDCTMVIDGKTYTWFQQAYTSSYYKMYDVMKKVFENLD